MKKYRFIGTSADTFARELKDEIDHCPSFPTEQGEIILKAIPTPKHITGPTIIHIGGYHVLPSGEDTKLGMKLGHVISFVIKPLTSERTKVIAESGSPAIVGHFMEWSNEHWPGETWHDGSSLTDTITELDKLGIPEHRKKQLTQYATQEDVVLEDMPVGYIRFFPDRIELGEREIIETREITETAEETTLGTPTPQMPAEDGAGEQRGPTVKAGDGLIPAEKEKTFRLKATPETFANWLQIHTKNAWIREFPAKGGYCKLRMAYDRIVPGAPSLMVTMDGYYIGETDNGEVTRFEPFLDNAITFEIMRLDPERIKVIARCNLPPVVSYFRELLAAIVADWPEAAEQPRAPTPPQVMTPFTEYLVIVKKSPRDLWDTLKRQKEQFEETNAPVMLVGPFYEADAIRCVLKYVPDPHKRIPDELHRGMIEAIEIPGGRGVRVICRLDTFPDPELFWQTVDKLTEKLGAPVAAIDRKVPVVGPPKWLPKKPETLRKWKEAYSTFVELRAEYRRRYDNFDTDDPNPKIGDYRDAIHRHYSEKVVGWILKAGDSGWLE
jgi:hypothetical protein